MEGVRRPVAVRCPSGFTLANMGAELRAVWASNIKYWKLDFAYPISFVRQCVSPLIFILPFLLYGLALVGGRYSDTLASLVGSGDMVTYTFLGYMVMGFIGTAVWAMGFSIRREQWFGTLESVYVTPASRLSHVFGMALHSTVHQALGTFLQFLAIYTIFGLVLEVGGIASTMVVFAMMMFALYGFGVLVSALGLILKEGWIVAEALHSLMMILSPVAYPIAVLPSIAQQLSNVFPTVPGLIGIRTFLLKGYTMETVMNVFMHLLILDSAWMLFGVVVFYLTDSYVRKRGTLGKY